MAAPTVQYVNRRGDKYYLRIRPSQVGGGRQYTFSRKPSGTPVEAIPDGYEIRELPDSGQVVLRKIKPSAIAPLERQLIGSAVRSQACRDWRSRRRMNCWRYWADRTSGPVRPGTRWFGNRTTVR